MKKTMKKTALGILSIATIGLIATTAAVHAYQGDPTKQGPNYDADLHDLKTDAFDSNDYEVWKDLMQQQGNGNKRILQVVTAENFDTFVEAHNAALAGELERSAELRASLGLNNGNGPRDGTGYRQGMGSDSGKGHASGRGNGQGLRDGTRAGNQ
jgi:hypothetical protein